MTRVYPQGRNSKLETLSAPLITPGLTVQLRTADRYTHFLPAVLLFLLGLLLASANACKRSHPAPRNRPDLHTLAARFENAIAEAGGTRVWIKHPTRVRRSENAAPALPVLATPEAYSAVRVRVQQEADQANLDLQIAPAPAGKGLRAASLSVGQHGQRFLEIHLREVPRLLRAAIIIDDMGRDLDSAHKLLALDYPLTFSLLPHLRCTRATAEEAHRAGREVMLHLPMEPESIAQVSPGEGAILVGMSAAEVRRVVQDDLDATPYAVGVNNHMGSRATQDAALMNEVMRLLAEQRLYFIDSRTTAASKALEAAHRQGLPSFYRAVFLDDTETVPYTLGQLQLLRHKVEEEGVALAIGHPHPTTIAALARFLPELERADIQLVPPSQIVRLPEVARLHPSAGAK